MEDEKVYVVAGSYRQALSYAKEEGIIEANLRYVTSERDVCGVDGNGKILRVYGLAYNNRDYHYILQAARQRGFGINFI